jgi:tRNA G10  N-methylase Trm11
VILYYASFIPGLQDFIADVIRERLSDVIIHKLLDGAVVFETETSYDKLNFFCFNNIFAVISIMEQNKSTDTLDNHIKTFINGDFDGNEVIANNSKYIRTFRIVISHENKPAAIDEKLRLEAEKSISRLSGLKVNRTLPDTEFWFLYRREEASQSKNFSVFMKRLTLHPSREKTLHKGELPQPLSWTMCRLARLSHSDTVLDPFCGYGSIPQEALKHFHIKKFIACDNDKQAALFSAERFKKQKTGEYTLFQTDFSTLPSLIADKSIDAIITDPPWGQYREIKDDAFYEKMFDVFGKLLKDGGRAVLLYANDDTLKKAVPACFKPEKNIPILLSGKKAVIYQFIKQ